MVTKEYWWAGAENKPVKSLRWARQIAGKRGDVLSWLRAQDVKVGRDIVNGGAIISDSGAKDPVETEDDEVG